jgi:hypothetical protein
MKPFLFSHLPKTDKQITAYGFYSAKEAKRESSPENTQALRAERKSNVRK